MLIRSQIVAQTLAQCGAARMPWAVDSAGAIWTPRALGSSLKLWLRGDSGVSATSGAIASWDPYQGSTLQFAQSSAALKPWARYINGRLAVDFDGGDILTGPTKTASGVWLTTPQWIAAVVMPDALAAGSALTAQGVLADDVTIDGLMISSTGVYHSMYQTGATLKTATSGTAPTTGTPQIIIGTHDGSTAITAQVYSGAVGTTASGAPLSGTGAHVLRLGMDAGGTHGLDGAICELIACNAIPSASAQALIVQYLSRWTSTTRTAQRVMACGDSIVIGYVDGSTVGTGGWRKHLATGLPLSRIFVGPDSDSVGAYRGTVGEKAQTVAGALSTFATQLSNAAPTIVILAWGTNDLGNGRTVLQLQTDMDAIVTQVRTTRPNATIVLPSVVPPTSGSYFTNLANYTSYNAALPAWAAARGCTFVDIGSATTGDGVHPVDGRTGYDTLAHALTTACLSVWG